MVTKEEFIRHIREKIPTPRKETFAEAKARYTPPPSEPVKEEPTPEPVKEEPTPEPEPYRETGRAGWGEWPKTTGIEPIPKKFLGLPEYQREWESFGITATEKLEEAYAAEKEIDPTAMYRMPIVEGRYVSEKELEAYLKTKPKGWIPQYRIFTGAEYISEYHAPYVSSLEKQQREVTKHLAETRKYPAGTTFIRTDVGFEVKIPETIQLEWARKERQKIEKLPPIIKEVAMFGYTATSTFAAMGKPVAPFILEQPERLGLFFGPYGWAMGKVMRETGFVPSGIKPAELKPVHYISGADIVFEPLGLAPKGAVEELRKTGPAGWAGAVAGETLQLYAIGQLLKPVGVGVKYVGGKVVTYPPVVKGITGITTRATRGISFVGEKVSPFLPKAITPSLKVARFGVKEFIRYSPKRAGLEIVKKVPYAVTEAPRATGRFGIAMERMGEKLGIIQITETGAKLTYHRAFPSITWKPWTRKLVVGGREIVHRVETKFGTFVSGKFQYPSRRLLTISGMYPKLVSPPTVYGTIGRDVFGISKRAVVYGIDPVTGKFALITTRQAIGRPYGVLGRKVVAGREISILEYQKMLIPDVTDISRTLTKEYGYRFRLSQLPDFWKGYPYFPAVGKGKVITLGKVAAKPSYPGAISGAMPKISLTRGEQQLLEFLKAVEPAYKPVSRIMPEALAARFPRMIFVAPPPIVTGARVGGVMVGGLFTVPHIVSVSEARLERRVERLPTYKPIVDKMATIKARGELIKPMTGVATTFGQVTLNINALATASISHIAQVTGQAQRIAKIQAQATMYRLKMLQKPVLVISRPPPRVPMPFMYVPPVVPGGGRPGGWGDWWELRYRFRKFTYPKITTPKTITIKPIKFKGIKI